MAMNILNKLLTLILILVMLMCAVVGVYAVAPGLFSAITGESGKEEGSTGNEEEAVSPTAGLIKRPEMPDFAPKPEPEEPKEESPIPEFMPESIAPEMETEYVVPDVRDLQVPSELLDRTGMLPVTEDAEELSGRDAKKLAEEISPGNTGEGLEFDPLYYPHYHMLDDVGKSIYRQIYANANDLNSGFSPVEEISAGGLKNAFSAVVNDHPELFWLDTAYGGKYTGAGELIEILLSFNRTANDLESSQGNFERSAEGILEGARDIRDQAEQEQYVHDALMDQLSYNLSAEMNQSAYSALVNGQTVCAGYSRAFQYLLMQLQIPCYYCTGFAGESHAWNIARIDEVFYNVDTTWDDARGNYEFYNKSDSDFGSSHIRTELGVYLPPCNDSVASPAGEEEVSENAIVNTPQRGAKRSLADVGLADAPVITDISAYYKDCTEKILANGLGSFEFTNVVQGEKLFGEIYADYVHDFYKEAYMNDVMQKLNAEFAEIRFDSEELEGGYYMIRHGLNITGYDYEDYDDEYYDDFF